MLHVSGVRDDVLNLDCSSLVSRIHALSAVFKERVQMLTDLLLSGYFIILRNLSRHCRAWLHLIVLGMTTCLV